MNLSRRHLAVFLVVFLFLAVNILFLDFLILRERKKETVQSVSTAPVRQGQGAQESCPEACLQAIRETEQNLTEIIPASGLPTPMFTPIGARGGAKEFFIGFGSGSTRLREWGDLAGLEAYIDRSKYEGIKEVVFEAFLSIPNGNQRVWARLYNATDGNLVWGSEVSLAGGTPSLVSSSPFVLSPGKNLYRVQMKTEIGDLATLTQARVKITVE